MAQRERKVGWEQSREGWDSARIPGKSSSLVPSCQMNSLLIELPQQVFGKHDDPSVAELPQHGFARVSKWEFLGKTSNSPANVQVDLGLSHNQVPQELREKWNHPFGLIYSVNLSRTSIETKMLVSNEGTESFKFHILFHTYFKVPVSTARIICTISGQSD